MKLNLRTILILVFLITSFGIIYQNILVQSVCILLTLILLLIIDPNKKKWSKLAKRLSKIGRVMLFLMVMQILFRRGGEVIFHWHFINIYADGLNYGIIGSLRLAMIIIVAGLLFDVPFPSYLLALKNWKISFEISFTVASVIHFIPIFALEFKKTREALELRTIDLTKIPFTAKPKAYMAILFPILARSLVDVKFRAISLELRAFRLYKNRTYLQSDKLKPLDIFIQISGGIVFITLNLYLLLRG